MRIFHISFPIYLSFPTAQGQKKYEHSAAMMMQWWKKSLAECYNK